MCVFKIDNLNSVYFHTIIILIKDKKHKGPRTKCTENGLMIKIYKKIFFLYFRTCKLKIEKKNVRKMDRF